MEKGVGGDGLGFLNPGLMFVPGLDGGRVEHKGMSPAGGARHAGPEGARARPSFRGRFFSILRPCLVFVIACLLLTAFAAGCGGSPGAGGGGREALVEQALRAALEGDEAAFSSLVAPSFMQEVRSEMPHVGEETLGDVLIAGFLEDIPFAGIVEPVYGMQADGDKAVVYVWGVFLDFAWKEIEIGEAEALRIPLVLEGDRWYIDLLDL